VPAGEVGARAFTAGLELHELAPRDVGLEGIFLRLVDGGGPSTPGPTSADAAHGRHAAREGAA
jgi:ABC-2 type transport system ATP-binding protein